MHPNSTPFRVPLSASAVYNDLNGAEIKAILRERFNQIIERVPFLQAHLTMPMLRMALHIDLTQFADASPDSGERIEIADNLEIVNRIHPQNPAQRTEESSGRSYSVTVDASPSPGGKAPDVHRVEHGMPLEKPVKGEKSIGAHFFTQDQEQATMPSSPAVPAYTLDDVIQESAIPVPSVSGGRSGEVDPAYSFSSEIPPEGAEVAERNVAAFGLADAIRIDQSGKGRLYYGDTEVKVDSRGLAGYREGKNGKLERFQGSGATTGTMDAGPAGLMAGQNNRSRLSFGNNRDRDS